MKNLVKISVIIPVYNTENYLDACLNSVRQQTLNEIEIICINDGSTDGSATILEKHQLVDERIIIITQENNGLSAARNIGIKYAIGKFVSFIDSDDLITGDFLEVLYHAAENNNAEVAMSNFLWFDNDTQKDENSWISTIIGGLKVNPITELNERKQIINTCTVCNKIFLRDFIIKNNLSFLEGLYWEDNPFTIVCALTAQRIVVETSVAYRCRKRQNSITGTAVYDRKPFDIFEIMNGLNIFFNGSEKFKNGDFRFLFAELKYIHYTSQFCNRVHKKHKKEFFIKMISEFKQFDNETQSYLCDKFKDYKYFKEKWYLVFRLKELFKQLN